MSRKVRRIVPERDLGTPPRWKPNALPVVRTAGVAANAEFSPTGKWVAFQLNESNRFEVYVQPFPHGDKVRISTDGGVQPRWRADGKELFYIDTDNRLIAVPVDLESVKTPKVGPPVPLFKTVLESGSSSSDDKELQRLSRWATIPRRRSPRNNKSSYGPPQLATGRVSTAFVCPLRRCARGKFALGRVRKDRGITSLPKTTLIGPIVSCPESRLRLDVLSIVQPLDGQELFYMTESTVRGEYILRWADE